VRRVNVTSEFLNVVPIEPTAMHLLRLHRFHQRRARHRRLRHDVVLAVALGAHAVLGKLRARARARIVEDEAREERVLGRRRIDCASASAHERGRPEQRAHRTSPRAPRARRRAQAQSPPASTRAHPPGHTAHQPAWSATLTGARTSACSHACTAPSASPAARSAASAAKNGGLSSRCPRRATGDGSACCVPRTSRWNASAGGARHCARARQPRPPPDASAQGRQARTASPATPSASA
jgi:hypothetical protein